ncbi:MAG: ion transporter [Bacteroidota bacterium]|jgi:voltage-gated potassium channel|nr:ion transporter [Bacteroidota bacterium]
MKQQIERERYKLLHSVEKLLEPPMVFLGFVWLVLLVVELIWGIPKMLEYVSLSIWGLFILDYILKFILAPDKISYMKKSWLTAFSLIIPALRIFRLAGAIRLLRGLRGIRFIRVVSSLNRSMKSLGKTMSRRGFGYVTLLTILIILGGAAGMYSLERGNPDFESYGSSLWWTAMRVITAGSASFPITPEGRTLGFLIAVYGYAIFGYVTATIATFFIGRDAEEKDTPVAGSKDVAALRTTIYSLTKTIEELKEAVEKK